jgi:predicted component of type VI protein secretion system
VKIEKTKKNKVLPARNGYLDSIIERKEACNESLRQIQEALTLNVANLWKEVHLLEKKKFMIEGEIRSMEKYLKTGKGTATQVNVNRSILEMRKALHPEQFK